MDIGFPIQPREDPFEGFSFSDFDHDLWYIVKQVWNASTPVLKKSWFHHISKMSFHHLVGKFDFRSFLQQSSHQLLCRK